VGDKVSIEETRPLSARKRHTLKEVISKAKLSREDLDVIEKESKVASKDDEEAKS
jgi:hypothetical protein